MDVYDSKGNYAGCVNSNGTIENDSGDVLGMVNGLGYVYNKHNTIVAEVDNNGIVGGRGGTIAVVKEDGTIYKPVSNRYAGGTDGPAGLPLMAAAAALLCSYLLNPDCPE